MMQKSEAAWKEFQRARGEWAGAAYGRQSWAKARCIARVHSALRERGFNAPSPAALICVHSCSCSLGRAPLFKVAG